MDFYLHSRICIVDRQSSHKRVGMEREKIKNLIIDLGGVLINLTRNRCIEAFENIGVSNIREQISNDYRHRELFERLELGFISVSEFRDGVRWLSGKSLTDDQIDVAWISMLGDIADYKLNLLLDLRHRYNTVLLSNTNELHWKYTEESYFSLDGHDVSDFFDKVYLSYELHMLKPDAEIFRYVMDDFGMKASETMLIDDASINCRAAEELGIKSYMPKAGEDWSHIFY